MTYLITGASRGIGLELTKLALKSGAAVIATARSPEKATELKALAGASGSKLKILALDTSSDASVATFHKNLGANEPIDVLINNAGVYLDQSGTGLQDLSTEILQKTLETNTLGPIRVTRALMPNLSLSKQPKVANISSLMGSMGDNSSGSAYAYRISKAALNMFTKNLSVERPNWVVLSMHPGWVQTDMGGKGASVTTEASASGLLDKIGNASLKDSGHFFDFRSRELPW